MIERKASPLFHTVTLSVLAEQGREKGVGEVGGQMLSFFPLQSIRLENQAKKGKNKLPSSSLCYLSLCFPA